mmetsp:Transcript_14716/g.42176  ORF Transcript_14716/g.42176 Transcript_14716/m.42176 type:complete len:208 (-) Transcript_14716:1566-2189(-)
MSVQVLAGVAGWRAGPAGGGSSWAAARGPGETGEPASLAVGLMPAEERLRLLSLAVKPAQKASRFWPENIGGELFNVLGVGTVRELPLALGVLGSPSDSPPVSSSLSAGLGELGARQAAGPEPAEPVPASPPSSGGPADEGSPEPPVQGQPKRKRLALDAEEGLGDICGGGSRTGDPHLDRPRSGGLHIVLDLGTVGSCTTLFRCRQ